MKKFRERLRRLISKLPSFKPQKAALASAFLGLVLSNCAGPKLYTQNELSRAVVYAFPEFPGVLTNQNCLEFKGDECLRWERKFYDLHDASIREQFERFSFVCNIAGKRYNACLEEAAFCRPITTCTWLQEIFGGCDVTLEKIPVEPHSVLVNGRARCFSEKAYDWDQVE
jgi:hypothetical protein